MSEHLFALLIHNDSETFESLRQILRALSVETYSLADFLHGLGGACGGACVAFGEDGVHFIWMGFKVTAAFLYGREQ